MSVELLRVEFRVVALQRDTDGIPLSEIPVCEGVQYASNLDGLPAAIRDQVTQAAARIEPGDTAP